MLPYKLTVYSLTEAMGAMVQMRHTMMAPHKRMMRTLMAIYGTSSSPMTSRKTRRRSGDGIAKSEGSTINGADVSAYSLVLCEFISNDYM